MNTPAKSLAYTLPPSTFRRIFSLLLLPLFVAGFFLLSNSNKATAQTVTAASVQRHFRNFIQTVQVFRQLCIEKQDMGWRQFATVEVQGKAKELAGRLWPEDTTGEGWTYFFSLSATSIARLSETNPVVGFYHPWSDVWLITAWQTTPEFIITDIEIVPGEWLRNSGRPPFNLEPDWLRDQGFRPEILARSFALNIDHFDKRIHATANSWRESLFLSIPVDTFAEIRMQTASANLARAWMNVMAFYDPEEKDTLLLQLRPAVNSILEAGGKGTLAAVLAAATGTTNETTQILRSLPASVFQQLNTVYWLADEHKVSVYLVPGTNSDFCLTLIFRREWPELTLERLDLLNFPEILQGIRKRGLP